MADKPTSMGVVDDVVNSNALHLNNSIVSEKQETFPTSPTESSRNDSSRSKQDLDSESTDSYSSDEQDQDDDDSLLKPMPVLAVCPMDVLPSNFDKVMTMDFPSSPNMQPYPLNMNLTSPSSQPQVLKRDPLAIRHQYWNQLGINLSVRDLERSTGRRRINRDSIKVKLNDIKEKQQSNSFFKAFSKWYTNETNSTITETSTLSPSTPIEEAKDTNVPQWLLQGQLTPPKIIKDASGTPPTKAEKKSIRFEEEADMFYIPVHKEFSKRQRDSMWYSREEFISMVERNLDEMYEEMEQEYEQNARMEALENNAMAAEESRQRHVEAAIKQQQDEMRQSVQLIPQNTQIKLTPRGRSPAEIRFKYLKHLGI